MFRSPTKLRFRLLALLAAAPLPAFAAARRTVATHPPAAQKSTSSAATAHYVGSEACADCHEGIATSFAQASMGHSMVAISPRLLTTLHLPASYTDPTTHHSYTVYAQDGKLWQSEYELAPGTADQEVFRSTHPIRWIIGTGENGIGGLLTRGGYLFQGPMSYYTQAGKWLLSPGYQHGDYGFNRIIQPGCISCHSARPQPIAGIDGKYAEPPFSHLSIGCENCHGPGSTHVEAMDRGNHHSRPDPTIVNPARLTRQLSDDICMSCHELGDARILEAGRTYQDFRPGQPLAKTLAIFTIAPTRQQPPDKDHLEPYSSMILSKCYRASLSQPDAHQMRCTTCHDPHVEPTHAEAPAYYNPKCLQCHTRSSCTESVALRRATTPADNCIGCHMPRRPITTISHTSATNHRILARPDEALPDSIYQQSTPQMPDLVHLDPSPSAPVPALRTRMLAYRMLMDREPALHDDWLQTLGQLEQTDAADPVVQTNLGHRDLLNQHYTEAINHLRQALQANPQQPEAWVDLSEAQARSGDTAGSIQSAQQAVAHDPYAAPLQKTLIARLIDAQQYDQAVAAMRQYLALFPEDDFIRKALAIAQQ